MKKTSSQNSYNPIEEYINDIKKYKITIGKNQKLAIKRYLELKKNKNYYLDLEEVNKIIDITNNLVLVTNGRIEHFKTRGFQNFILGNLVGWKYKESGLRLYNEAYIQLGRQNGKSLLLASLSIYFSSFDKFINSKIFCTATKMDQAKIVWSKIADFIKYNKILNKKYYKIQEHKHTITSLKKDNKIVALGRDTKSMDGFDSCLGIIDEYHSHKNNQMYKLILDGQINVPNSLIVAITTAGFNLSSACYKQYEDCVNILNGLVEKDTQFIFIADPDENDKLDSFKTWAKANPFLMYNDDYTTNKKLVSEFDVASNDAIRKQNEELLNFKTKKLNMWVQFSNNDYLDKERVKMCESDLSIQDMRGKSAILGIDLSSGGDLTSISLIFDVEDGKSFVYSHSFIPSENLERREQNTRIPYREWVNSGLLTLTPGFKTDYKVVLEHIKNIMEEYNITIKDTAYDPYGAGAWLQDLTDIVGSATSITQSARNLGSTVEDFKLSIDELSILYNKNDYLYKWCLANAKVVYNSFKEPKVVKGNKNEKIDPIISTINAWYLKYNNSEIVVDYNDEFDTWYEMFN